MVTVVVHRDTSDIFFTYQMCSPVVCM